MRFETPPDLPRRELEEPPRLVWEYGLPFLVVTVLRIAGVSKRTGEVRYRRLETRYRVARGEGAVVLVTNRLDPETGQPVRHFVTLWGCSCPDARVRGRERHCKHWTSCDELKLWDGPVADEKGAW